MLLKEYVSIDVDTEIEPWCVHVSMEEDPSDGALRTCREVMELLARRLARLVRTAAAPRG